MNKRCETYYWRNEERCLDAIKKCKSRQEFNRNYHSAWIYLKSINKLNVAYEFLSEKGDMYKKIGYKITFKSLLDDKIYIYIGLTCNFERRLTEHLNCKKGNLYNLIKKHKLIYEKSWIYHELLPIETAKNIEIENINLYKDDKKYVLLNLGNGGEGGNIKRIWTKEKCEEELKNCKTIYECRNNHHTAYKTSIENKWLYEITSHIERKIKPKGYWLNKNNCFEVAKKCKNRIEFSDKFGLPYTISRENNWLDEFFPDIKKQKNKGYWLNKNNFIFAVKECKTRKELKNKFSRAYVVGLKYGWVDEFFPICI